MLYTTSGTGGVLPPTPVRSLVDFLFSLSCSGTGFTRYGWFIIEAKPNNLISTHPPHPHLASLDTGHGGFRVWYRPINFTPWVPGLVQAYKVYNPRVIPIAMSTVE